MRYNVNLADSIGGAAFWFPHHRSGLSSRGLAASFSSQQQHEADEETEVEEELDEEKVNELVEAVQAAAKAATRATERAGAFAESVRLETFDEAVQQAAQDAEAIVAKVPFDLRTANVGLRKLYEDREVLNQVEQLGAKADPFMEKRVYKEAEKHLNEALETLSPALEESMAAKKLQQTANRLATLATPIIHDTDVKMMPPAEDEKMPKAPAGAGTEEMDAEERVNETIKGTPDGTGTSAGCTCDDAVKCSNQGQPFTWCQVGGGRCAIERAQFGTAEAGGKVTPNWMDPAYTDHHVYNFPGPFPASGTHHEQSGYIWDYCTPAPKKVAKGAAPKTAHGGLCAWRGDLYERYQKDPKYDKDTVKKGPKRVDVEKIPWNDRLALEVMLQYKGAVDKHLEGLAKHTLCDETPSSKPYKVCPAIPDPDNPEAGTSGWLASRSWDFCTDGEWTPLPSEPPPSVKQLDKAAEPVPEEEREVGEFGPEGPNGQGLGPGGAGGVAFPVPTKEELAKKTFETGTPGQGCPNGGDITDEVTCEAACKQEQQSLSYEGSDNWDKRPYGCNFKAGGTCFFNNYMGNADQNYTPLCEVKAGPLQPISALEVSSSPPRAFEQTSFTTHMVDSSTQISRKRAHTQFLSFTDAAFDRAGASSACGGSPTWGDSTPTPKRMRSAHTGPTDRDNELAGMRAKLQIALPLEVSLAMVQLRPTPATSPSPRAKPAAAPPGPPQSLRPPKPKQQQSLAVPHSVCAPPLRRPPRPRQQRRLWQRLRRPAAGQKNAELAAFLPELGQLAEVCRQCGR